MSSPARRNRFAARRFHPFAGISGFDELYDQMSRMLTTAFPDVARISVRSWAPPVDIHETDRAYHIEADLPGVRPEDVSVELQRNELRISGHYGGEGRGGPAGGGSEGRDAGSTGGNGHSEQHRQVRKGRFDYRVSLPGETNADASSAELEHGVLRLRLPKTSPSHKRIEVRTVSSGSPQSIGSPTNGGQERQGEQQVGQTVSPSGFSGAGQGSSGGQSSYDDQGSYGSQESRSSYSNQGSETGQASQGTNPS